MEAAALTIEEDRRRKMVALSPRMHGPAPGRYRASAEWWRLHAEESAAPDVCLGYADAQDRLADDMENRPAHYRTKPADMTDWQRSGLAPADRTEPRG
jgi:hypothetical protein